MIDCRGVPSSLFLYHLRLGSDKRPAWLAAGVAPPSTGICRAFGVVIRLFSTVPLPRAEPRLCISTCRDVPLRSHNAHSCVSAISEPDRGNLEADAVDCTSELLEVWSVLSEWNHRRTPSLAIVTRFEDTDDDLALVSASHSMGSSLCNQTGFPGYGTDMQTRSDRLMSSYPAADRVSLGMRRTKDGLVFRLRRRLS